MTEKRMPHRMIHAQGESRLCYLLFLSSGFCLLTALTVTVTASYSYKLQPPFDISGSDTINTCDQSCHQKEFQPEN